MNLLEMLPRLFSRRTMIGWALTAASSAYASRATPAVSTCRYQKERNLCKRVVPLPEATYFTYPHSNGFIDAKRCVLARKLDDIQTEYILFDLDAGTSTQIAIVRNARLYYALSKTGQMAIPMADGVSLLDVHTGAIRRVVSFDDSRVLADCDISPDGTKVLINRFQLSNSKKSEVDIVDVASGGIRTVFTADFPLDHAHFSPFDPNWVFFCDGSPHSRQRMWVWHATLAPAGRKIFNQVVDGKYFDCGHERALFNKLSLLAIVYADSSATPRGLYEVSFDGKAQAISSSNSDSHCNISSDGRWAVVSSLSPVETADGNIDLCASTPSDWTKSQTNYVISDITAVDMKSGKRQFLYRSSNAVTEHGSLQPYEPQPAISPDGRWVLIKDAKSQRVVALEIDLREMGAFLQA